jgi:hypothetical protein
VASKAMPKAVLIDRRPEYGRVPLAFMVLSRCEEASRYMKTREDKQGLRTGNLLTDCYRNAKEIRRLLKTPSLDYAPSGFIRG